MPEIPSRPEGAENWRKGKNFGRKDGKCIVCEDRKAVTVDGRYCLECADQFLDLVPFADLPDFGAASLIHMDY